MNDGSIFLSIEEDNPGLYVDGDFNGGVICIETAVKDSIADLTTEMLIKYNEVFCNSYIAIREAMSERLLVLESLIND